MKTDKYIVYCKKSDFYIGDAIVRCLQEKNKKCQFWYDEIPVINIDEILKNQNFISVINPELVKDSEVVSLIEKATLSTQGNVVFLENEKLESFPESWGEARYIDATYGINKEIVETLLGIIKTPVGQVVNIKKEIENLKKAEQERLEKERLAAEAERKEKEEAARIEEENAKKVAEQKEKEERKIFERIYNFTNLSESIIENEDVSSSVKKGIKYLKGEGFPKDEERAFSIFKKALNENPNDIYANYYFALCLDKVFHDIEDKVKTEELIESSYKLSAENGIKQAAVALINFYISHSDFSKAEGWLENLLKQNYSKAKYYQGIIAEAKDDYKKALDYYYEAAEEGTPEAQNAVGYMLGEGWGTEIDSFRSLQWFKLAAERGLPSAKYNLALTLILSKDSENKAEARNILNELAAIQHQKSIQLLNELRREEEKEKKKQQKKEENEMVKQKLIDAGLNLFKQASNELGIGKTLKDYL